MATYVQRVANRTYSFGSLRDLMAKATPPRSGDVLAGVAADGAVTVEGHYVGKLTGVQFEPAHGGSALEEKALRAAATHAVVATSITAACLIATATKAQTTTSA